MEISVVCLGLNVVELGILAWVLSKVWEIPTPRVIIKKVPMPVRVEVPVPVEVPTTPKMVEVDKSQPVEGYEIIRREGKNWIHVGHRPQGHPDIKEALDTPGLAVIYPDKTRDFGNQ